MTLNEAIKWLKEDILTQHPYTPGRSSEAKQLGIEAMRTVQNIRRQNYGMHIPLLPSETKE